jgi:hypothetical protein
VPRITAVFEPPAVADMADTLPRPHAILVRAATTTQEPMKLFTGLMLAAAPPMRAGP